MDELRRSVQNASIEQKDPLLIYKLESFNLFKAMIERMNGDIVGFLSKAGLPSAQPQVQEAPAPRPPQQRVETSRTEVPQYSSGSSASAPRPTTGAPAPGRGPMPPPQQALPAPPPPLCGWTRHPAATIPAPVVAARSTSSATGRAPEHDPLNSRRPPIARGPSCLWCMDVGNA
jgi:hypothetical protein